MAERPLPAMARDVKAMRIAITAEMTELKEKLAALEANVATLTEKAVPALESLDKIMSAVAKGVEKDGGPTIHMGTEKVFLKRGRIVLDGRIPEDAISVRGLCAMGWEKIRDQFPEKPTLADFQKAASTVLGTLTNLVWNIPAIIKYLKCFIVNSTDVKVDGKELAELIKKTDEVLDDQTDADGQPNPPAHKQLTCGDCGSMLSRCEVVDKPVAADTDPNDVGCDGPM